MPDKIIKILSNLKEKIFCNLDAHSNFHPLLGIVVLQHAGIYDIDILAAFAGHDILEDVSDESIHETLREIVGEESFKIIQELTFDKSLMSKADYLKSFESKSVESLICKVVDRIINVQGFLVSKPDYAFKYLHKADDLMEIFKDRSSEVIERFGILSYYYINLLLDFLRNEENKL